MFPGDGEVCLDDINVIKNIKQFIDKSCSNENLYSKLQYSVTIPLEANSFTLKISLPREYPSVNPEIHVSSGLKRDEQCQLNKDLHMYLENTEVGSLKIISTIVWLQENGHLYVSSGSIPSCGAVGIKSPPPFVETVVFVRLWIYSHHIYSKIKRKDILSLTKELNLSGFCLPGKPGIVCVEGLSRNTEEFWQTVRSWNWHKILCKSREENEVKNNELDKQRRFSCFEELGSETVKIKPNGRHVDMGDVYRYLEEHNCGYMFKEYFGIETKQ